MTLIDVIDKFAMGSFSLRVSANYSSCHDSVTYNSDLRIISPLQGFSKHEIFFL